MGKGYYSDLEFRRELNRINAENRYNELLQETYNSKEKDYSDFRSQFDPSEYESSLGLIGDDW